MARALALVAEADGDTDTAFAHLADARVRCNRLADPYVWLDVHILDAQCLLGPRHSHPDTPAWADRMHDIASRTGMKKLVVRAFLHRAALGGAGAAGRSGRRALRRRHRQPRPGSAAGPVSLERLGPRSEPTRVGSPGTACGPGCASLKGMFSVHATKKLLARVKAPLAVRLARTPCSPLSKRHISPDRELFALVQHTSARHSASPPSAVTAPR